MSGEQTENFHIRIPPWCPEKSNRFQVFKKTFKFEILRKGDLLSGNICQGAPKKEAGIQKQCS